MKKIFSLITAVLVSSSLLAQLPNTTIKEMSGKPVKFNSIFEEGKVTLVSFWATWCVPCKAEIHNIQEQLEDWQEETDFNFVTVSIDDSRAQAMVKTYTRSKGWEWPNYLDPNSDLKRSLNFQNVPYTIIVDQNGKIVYQHTGYEEGGENEVYEIVKQTVNGTSAETDAADEEVIEEMKKELPAAVEVRMEKVQTIAPGAEPETAPRKVLEE